MNASEVKDALESLRIISGENHIVVIGSQSLHGAYPDMPDQILYSREVDVMLLNKARLANWISDVVGEGTPFEAERGYFIDHVVPNGDLPALADGWQQRVVRNTEIPGCVVDFLSPEDLVIAKLAAGREKDFLFVAGMAARDLVDFDKVRELLQGQDRLRVALQNLGELEAKSDAVSREREK